MEASVAAQPRVERKTAGELPSLNRLKSLAVKISLSSPELTAIIELAGRLEDPVHQLFSTATRLAQSGNTQGVSPDAQTLSPSVEQENAARVAEAVLQEGLKIARGIPALFAAAFLAAGAIGKEAGNQGRAAYCEQYQVNGKG